MERYAPSKAQQRLEAGEACLLDVREPSELALASIEGAIHIPLAQIPQAVEQLPRDQEIIVLCHHGVRSAMAADFLERNGFESVSNLEGGIDAWSREVDSEIPRY